MFFNTPKALETLGGAKLVEKHKRELKKLLTTLLNRIIFNQNVDKCILPNKYMHRNRNVIHNKYKKKRTYNKKRNSKTYNHANIAGITEIDSRNIQ